MDRAGNLFIADTDNFRIRRVDRSGVITTITGTAEEGFSGDNGPAVEAQLERPQGVAADRGGNLFIAEWSVFRTNRIRRVDQSGIITTFAGGGSGGDGGPAVEARLNRPTKAAFDRAGNLFIADSLNHRVRRVDATGTITTVAGTGEKGYSGDGGPAVHARLNQPSDVAVDGAGNLFIAETGNHSVRRVEPDGTITTVTTELYYPRGLAVDGAGNVFIADTDNHRIRQVDPSGTITTVAGTGRNGYSGDNGPAVEAQLARPGDVEVDGAGNLLIADSWNNSIRRVDPGGIVTTIVGLGIAGFGGDGGPAAVAALYGPHGVAVDGAGNLIIADSFNSRIRQVDPSGTITTIAGPGEDASWVGGFRGDGGLATDAALRDPGGVAVDGLGNVYIADTRNDRIRILTRASHSLTLHPPTGLRATAISSARINLSWQDNNTNETGFRVQRKLDDSWIWIEVGATPANTTRFSDTGIEADTTYHYRVRAYNSIGSSNFSNEAEATTGKASPPTLTGFSPTRGPAGAKVTLTGTHLLGATAVKFNGVPAARFEVLSETGIEAVVPLRATSGPISVETPGGTAVSAESFTVTTGGISRRLFVPIVLRSQGRTAGSFFTTELTLTNRGDSTTAIRYTYRAAFGGGSGAAVDSLGPGQQQVIPDAISYLTSLGVPINSRSAGGTLVVDFSNLFSASDAAVTVRVATPVEEGRAGLAFPGLNPGGLLTDPAFIAGLRENRQDRSNLAVQNAGDANITLKVTVFSGDPASAGRSVALPDRTLPPGGFHQYNRILDAAGFENGYVKVERVSGPAPFYAYGVINDNFNSDGSFVFPVRAQSLAGKRGQTLPVIIETGTFNSELTLTNFSPVSRTMEFRFVAEGVQTDHETAGFSLRLEAGEQRIIPGIIDWLRQREVAGIGAARRPLVGALFATVARGDMSGTVIGARTGAPDERGGLYSLFYNGVPYGSASDESAWIYGLQQNAENRSNLALVNTGEIDGSPITFEITVYDGSGESQPRTRNVTLGPRRWTQENGILGNIRQGYVQVRKTSGSNPFVAYGVVNDGGRPGERSGDGAFVPSQE